MKKTKKVSRRPVESHPRELLLLEPKTLIVIIITSVLTLLVSFLGERGIKFMTSVVSPVPAHAPFDGTTFPIKQIPNWVKLTEAERKAAYSAIPADKIIAIPTYNPSHLAIPTSDLRWNNADDDVIRNEKITYSTPYLGDYRLNGLENVGSHPAIDIKVPEGTPVYAMANGTVIKAQYSNGGFGNHVALQHNDFPTIDDPNSKTTFYSSYSHLSSISVKVYDVVTKGQLLGFSGSSGTATTPHLHFQIDNDVSAWHPYWPFTTADMNASGLSFFEAINNGLKKENAVANTINPMRYVQKYFGNQSLMVSAQPEIIEAISAATDEYNSVAFMLKISGATTFTEGDSIKFVIQAFDSKGNLLNKPKFTDEVKLSLLNGNGKLNRETLLAADLMAGITSEININETKVGKDKLILRFREQEFSSPEFEIVAKKTIVAGFTVIPQVTSVPLGETVDVGIRAVDLDGTVLNDFVLNENLSAQLNNDSGTLNFQSLVVSNFSSGEAHLKMTAKTAGTTQLIVNYGGLSFYSPTITIVDPNPVVVEQPVVPVIIPATTVVTQPEAGTTTEVVGTTTTVDIVQVIQLGTTTPEVIAPELPFEDILENSQYFTVLKKLKEIGLVSGYGDGTFKPDREVSRAEAITFILKAIDEKLKEQLEKTFPDVPLTAWFSKYVFTAFELGFVKGYPDGSFRPDSPVTLAEFFTMYFVAAKTDIDPQIVSTLPAGITANDWFAPYLQEAIKKNILEVTNNSVDAGKQLTRGDIAKILYRIKELEEQLK